MTTKHRAKQMVLSGGGSRSIPTRADAAELAVTERTVQRVFAVHRIDSASATNHRFEISESFNFDEFTGSAFQMVWGEPQHVAIRFRADQAPYVTERTWHSSQRIIRESVSGWPTVSHCLPCA